MNKYKLSLNYPFVIFNLFGYLVMTVILALSFGGAIGFSIFLFSGIYMIINIVYIFTYKIELNPATKEITRKTFGCIMNRLNINELKRINYTVRPIDWSTFFSEGQWLQIVQSQFLTDVVIIDDNANKEVVFRNDISDLLLQLPKINPDIQVTGVPFKGLSDYVKYRNDLLFKNNKLSKNIGYVMYILLAMLFCFMIFLLINIYSTSK